MISKRVALLTMLVLALSSPTFANTISYASYAATNFNTDFVTSNIGLRDVGADYLSVSGVTGSVTPSLNGSRGLGLQAVENQLHQRQALTRYISGGQSSDDGTLRGNGAGLASGKISRSLSPRATGAGVSNGSLSNIETFAITSVLTPSLNSMYVAPAAGLDNTQSAVVASVDVPVAAAIPAVPEPGTYVLLGTGLLALYSLRRNRSRTNEK
jgi:PEP-CTERM motif